MSRTKQPDRCTITIIDESGLNPVIDEQRLQTVIDAALAEDGQERTALTVLLVDDEESRRLHVEHFDNPDATDVMTFPDGNEDPESGLTHLGDLAVGVEVAQREAAIRNRPVGDELILYILHGVLHLLGFDDEDEDDLAQMWAVQRRLLHTVGIELETEPT